MRLLANCAPGASGRRTTPMARCSRLRCRLHEVAADAPHLTGAHAAPMSPISSPPPQPNALHPLGRARAVSERFAVDVFHTLRAVFPPASLSRLNAAACHRLPRDVTLWGARGGMALVGVGLFGNVRFAVPHRAAHQPRPTAVCPTVASQPIGRG
jgi:hypothetical protein